jgi:hypothetical protein
MANDPIAEKVAKAKSVLHGAEGKFPGAMASASGVTPAGARVTPVAKVTPPKPRTEGEDTAAGLKAVQDNVNQYQQANAPKMHTGGTVPKTGIYTLEKGEEVIPKGRASEYRKVFLNRKTKTADAKPQTRQDGGNTPVKGESHDSGKKKVPYKQAQE